MKRISKLLDIIPAVLLGVMALLTSVSVASRYLFNQPVPDEYELSRLLLSVVICWGIAVAFRGKNHIYLDLFWGRVGPRGKAALSRIGAAISFLIVSGYSYMLLLKALDTMASHNRTIELGVPVWGFQMAAWVGTVAAAFVLLSQIVNPDIFQDDTTPDQVDNTL